MMNDMCLQIDGHVKLLPFQGEGIVCTLRYPRRCRWAESSMPRWGVSCHHQKIGLKAQQAFSPMATPWDTRDRIENALKGQKQYAIGLRVPRTRDYLKQLLEMGLIEEEGEVRYKVYNIKKK